MRLLVLLSAVVFGLIQLVAAMIHTEGAVFSILLLVEQAWCRLSTGEDTISKGNFRGERLRHRRHSGQTYTDLFLATLMSEGMAPSICAPIQLNKDIRLIKQVYAS
jgi:hypothetical protein